MKKTIIYALTLASAFVFNAAKAQTWVSDSAIMSAGYGNDVYYSFDNSTVKTSANNNWDLAFRTGLQTDGVFINSISSSSNGSIRNVKMFLYPNAGISGWATFDTAGYLSWPQNYNSDTSWEVGAFNRSAGAFPDVSWGVYNTTTHIVSGDSIYLIRIESGTTGNFEYKKMYIKEKNFGDWIIRHADIDGTNERYDTLKQADYATKNFSYFDLITAAKLDREPATADWDIVFTRYNTLIAGSYYPVTGVLSNIGVRVAEARGVDIDTVKETSYDTGAYLKNISVIGSDWKTFNMTTFLYEVEDSLCYIVKAKTGAIWKLQFTGFVSSQGKSQFRKMKLTVGTGVAESPIASFGAYPNPVNDKLELAYENRENSVKNILHIYDITGKVVQTHELTSTPGFYTSTVNVSALPSGIYFVALENGGHSMVQKIVKY